MRKVKYPVRAAHARFLPIYNHLTNMADYLDQADLEALALYVRFDVLEFIKALEGDVKPFLEKGKTNA